MKRIVGIFCIALIFVNLCYSQNKRRVEILNTVAGELKIDSAGMSSYEDNDDKSYIYLNDKVIHNIDGNEDTNLAKGGNFMLDVHGYFKTVDSNWMSEIVIIHEFNGGNSCNGIYRIVSLRKGGKYKVFQEMGNCTPPTIIWEPTKITIKFPYLNKGAIAQTWVYQNEILKQIQDKPKK